MLTKLVDWLDERIRVKSLWKAMTDRPIPGGSSWFYVLGATLAFIFVLQLTTGIFPVHPGGKRPGRDRNDPTVRSASAS